MRKKTFFLLFLLGGTYLIIVLARDLWKILGAKNRLLEAEQQVSELEQEQMELKEDLALAETDEFVEKEARDKLMLAKEREVVVLLPSVDGIENGRLELEKEEPSLANWEKWLRLFVY